MWDRGGAVWCPRAGRLGDAGPGSYSSIPIGLHCQRRKQLRRTPIVGGPVERLAPRIKAVSHTRPAWQDRRRRKSDAEIACKQRSRSILCTA
jgi:hypothetical protein